MSSKQDAKKSSDHHVAPPAAGKGSSSSGAPVSHGPIKSGAATARHVGSGAAMAARPDRRPHRGALPGIRYSAEIARSLLRRPPELEATRSALPAAEAEGRVLSFLLQQQHPSVNDADEVPSSSEEEANTAGERACKKRKAKKMQDLSGCRHADVMCVSGATGSGKSTQIPQFVFESGICYPSMLFPKNCEAARQALAEEGKVPRGAKEEETTTTAFTDSPEGEATDMQTLPGDVTAEETKEGILVKRQMCVCITQPRRVAATALAHRVAEEMGAPELVGYQVRYEKHNVGPQCRLKFATDGVLLRELQHDFLASKYCCIIVDEAHERSVNVDLILGLLSRIVVLRRERYRKGVDVLPPLKVLVMSATLNAADFTENAHLFYPSPALLSLDSRTFDVRIHFSKKTATQYVDAAIKKVLQIHTRLPPGSVLVFLTGRAEVLAAVRQLQEWQRRRDRTSNFGRACTESVAAAPPEDVGISCEEDFELSDHSDTEVPSLEGTPDIDVDHVHSVSYGSRDISSYPASHKTKMKPILHQQLQLALESDAEEDEKPLDDIKEAEADVLKAVLAGQCSSVPSTVKNDGPMRAPEGSAPVSPVASQEAVSAHTKPGVTSSSPKQATSPGNYKADNAVQAFECPDTIKRRVRNTVSPGGWLGAGARLLERPAEGDGMTKEARTGGDRNETTERHEQVHLVPRLTVLPLYASLPGELQRLAFEPPAPDERRVIVATNVAETSITLPNVRYVVDSGREKRRVFSSGSDCFSYFTVTLTSQAAAQQRAGRAGRVGAGVCYRLYSSVVYQHEMEAHAPPQIHSVPLDHLLLFMAALGIPRPSAFPFPSPPPSTALAVARNRLIALGALERKGSAQSTRSQDQNQKSTKEPEVCCSVLGRRMSELPIPPRFAKMLLLACSRFKEHGGQFVALACYVVAALTVGELLPSRRRDGFFEESAFGKTSEGDMATPKVQRPWEEYDSDIDAYIWLCGAYSHSRHPTSFCRTYCLDSARMAEVGALAAQLAQLVRSLLQRSRQSHQGLGAGTLEKEVDDLLVLKPPLRLDLPDVQSRRCLHQCVVQGLIDHVAVWQDPPRLPADATAAERESARGGYRCGELKGQLALIHPSSNVLHVTPRPKLLVYNQLIHEGRAVLHVCTPLDGAELSGIDTPMIQHTFLQTPAPAYDERRDAVVGWTRPTYSPLQLPLPAVERPLPRIRAKHAKLLSPQEKQQQEQLYKCFAAALVAGRAIPRLKRFTASLAVTPEGMLAGDRAGTFAVRAFVGELAMRNIASRMELLKVWKTEPKYLLAEFIGLLRSYNYETLQDVRDMWPPL
ncbi:probable ATP-dependent RNA helicase kurz [Cyclospora cayetanensis]|uniref:Probable ATP-dependent RNA helicase kurz n=1 Tax=Cyclospora cayetanensis TaxID=88456 RepID=A0A6P6S2L7_9EIME|nr:probable ATP-dependent RNA helicase kurz [Cyclospora cayetanensis]